MDNYDNHMDETFKSRFEGLKDHSVNPSEQWASFQEAMATSSSAAGAASGSGFFSSMSSWAAAASFAALVTVASVVPGDQGSEASYSSITDASTIAGSEQLLKSSNNAVGSAEVANFNAIATPSSTSGSVSATINGSSSSAVPDVAFHENAFTDPSVASKKNALKQPISMAGSASAQPRGEAIITPPAELAAAEYSLAAVDRSMLSSIPMRNLENAEPALAGADVVEFHSQKAKRFKHLAFVELRAGMRLGAGERNTTVPSDLFINPYASLGAGYRISDAVNVTAGIGYVRRAGNSLERKKDYDISQLSDFVGNNYSSVSQEAPSEGSIPNGLELEQSIVTTRTDWIQFPLAVELNTSDRTKAYVGGYAEYMIHAKNDVYLVYDETQYVLAPLSGIEETRFVGLRRFRYGAMVGGSYQVRERLSVDGRVLISMNSSLKDDGEYKVRKEPNRGFDFQVGVSYRL